MKPFLITTLFVALSTTSFADANKFQPKGHIQNGDGQKCSYTQVVDRGSKYFHGSLTSNIGVLTFDDPKCMPATDINYDLSIMMINNVITRWYSHSDAAFKTKAQDLYKSSALQQRGRCIQSATYPAIGVTVDYITEDGYVTEVRHGPSLQGCTK